MTTVERLGAVTAKARAREAPTLLVLYAAEWCGYTGLFRPAFEAYAAEGRVPAVIGDLTSAPDADWDAVGVAVVPTVILYEAGREVARLDGVAGRGIRATDFRAFTARIPRDAAR